VIFAAFLIFLGFFVFYIVLPFFDRSYKNQTIIAAPEKREKLIYRKEEILKAISDLEYDFKLKKMAETDYLQLKEKLSREAIEVMKQLDSVEGLTRQNAVRFDAAKGRKISS
jgi:hypothetical protein